MIFFPPPRVITGRNNYYRVVNEEKRRMLARNFHDGVSDYEERIVASFAIFQRSIRCFEVRCT